MTDLSINSLKIQGRKVKCVYGYKATMNDELNIKIDDVIILTQCSEDETWLEGTLNGLTGWFPSNYVQLLAEDECEHQNDNHISPKCHEQEFIDEQRRSIDDTQSKFNETLRIKYINELKKTEEGFLDEMCKFVKITIMPLLSSKEIFPMVFVQQLNTSVDEVIRCHQAFYQQLKEIPDDADAKVGNLLINMASQFKAVYETYARNNPKFTNVINKKKEQLSKYFESSLSKMSSPLLPISSNMTVSIYITKFLAAPFKQLEIYVKIMKEIYRYTEDYHIDRGDIQRCIEFYSDLMLNVQETRKKKEYEQDILSSKINNMDEDLFKNGEVLFISTVLVINEPGDKKDRIMLILPNHIVFLHQSLVNSTNEFDFEFKIPLSNPNIHAKKVTSLDSVNAQYGGNLLNSSLVSSYLLELSGLGVSNNSRLLIAFPTQYDMKHSIDLIINLLAKNKSNMITKPVQGGLVRQGSGSSSNKQQQQSHAQSQRDCTSPVNFGGQNNSNNNVSVNTNTSLNNSTVATKKIFTLRPHPPLIPHFQLPNDLPQTTSLDGSSTLKRFMYKKPKLSEPFGKYHGADDDLKLLNVIESLCKTRIRQSINVNLQDVAGSLCSKPMSLLNTETLVSSPKTNGSPLVTSNGEKGLSKIVTRLSEDKSRLEANVQAVTNELGEYKKSNKELKSIISSMQKQLDNEKLMRRKLETYVRKHMKNQNSGVSSNGGDLIHNILMNIEHESSI